MRYYSMLIGGLSAFVLVLLAISEILSNSTPSREELCQQRWPSRQTYFANNVCMVDHDGEFVPSSAIKLD